MLIKFLEKEDFVNYKKCSMVIGFPYCTFKCDKENGCQLCQNYPLFKQENKDISIERLFEIYKSSDTTEAIVFGGLEPFDSFRDMEKLIEYFRSHECLDDIVIYTGYTEDEILNDSEKSKILKFANLIIKYGRFKPNQTPKYDEVLGITLISPNQYAVKYN